MIESDFKKSPVYLQIREYIYNRIISGEYKAGDKLPSEDKLAEQFGVSRMTVNKALMELVNREYLTRIQGSGTFVSKMRKEGSTSANMSFNDSLTSKGFKVNTKVYDKKLIIPSKEVAELLNIPVTEKVLYLRRLRFVNNEPIVVQEAYLTTAVSSKLINIDFEQYSLYAVLREVCGEEIIRAKDIVEAKAADEEVSQVLCIKSGFPVLKIRRVAFNSMDKPIELSYSIYRSDQYELEVEYK